MPCLNARALRSTPTDAEKKLWSRPRLKQLHGNRFRRQVPIGPYIVDFCCLAERLVIEVDGGQHDANVVKDDARTEYLERQGFRVVRFWNNDVLGNIEGVLEVIVAQLASGTPHPNPPPQGGRE